VLLRNVRVSGGSGELVDILPVNGMIASVATATGREMGVDLGGEWVSPGLWDNHVHFTQWALLRQRLDVSAAGSAAEAALLVAAALASSGKRHVPLVGVGFRDGLWEDQPTAALLDAAAGDLPVVLVSGDLHCVWLNTAALRLYGYDGHPSGVLRENEAFDVTTRINTAPVEVLDDWADAAARAASSRGVVGIVDFEMSWNLGDWSRRMAAGSDCLRVEFGIYPEHLDRAIAEGLRTGDRVNELLNVGRVKIITDGSLNTRTAYNFRQYPGLHGHEHPNGMLTIAQGDLVSIMRRAHAGGLECSVHAIGDHANSLALDAFETVGCHGRIEHAQLLADADFDRFGALGVEASVQPEHAMDDRDVAERYWPGDTGRSFALRRLLDEGARLAFGSDAPVAPLDPWVSMAAAVSRGRDGRDSWHPEQSVSVAEALRASTRGRVAVGERADLVVTPIDPLAASADQLRDMPVSATLLGGRFTHRRGVPVERPARDAAIR
jgi:predicted amidohydrolase YtcJ